MELVSEMLQIAMAEDGDETDEVKEEYGKKMDETLADLRGRLEEARRNEGKPPLEPPEPSQAGVVAGHDEAEKKRIEELESALATSQERVSRSCTSYVCGLLIHIQGIHSRSRTCVVAGEDAKAWRRGRGCGKRCG